MAGKTEETYDYSEFAADAATDVGDNLMATLSALAHEQVAAEALIASLEQQLVEAKESLRAIKEDRLPAVMDDIELTQFTTRDGIEIEIAEIIRGSIPKETEAKAFEWLETNKQGRLIKRQFVIEFGKEEDKWADKFERDLRQRKKPLAVKRKKTVNPQTLQAFVRSQLSEGVDFPMKLFGVFRQRFAKVTVKSEQGA